MLRMLEEGKETLAESTLRKIAFVQRAGERHYSSRLRGKERFNDVTQRIHNLIPKGGN